MPRLVVLLSVLSACIVVPRMAGAAEITVFSDGPLAPALTRLAASFRGDSGHDTRFVTGLSPVIHKRITDGEPGDLVIIQPNFVAELVKAGKVAAGEHPVIARLGIGLMARAGAATPDIFTAEAFKQALLRADSVVFNNVASGNAFANLLERIGLAEALKSKIVRASPAEVTARILQGTGNDIGVGPTTVILADKRMKLVGALPAELQDPIPYAAAPMTGAKEPEAAKAFIQFLTSPKGRAEFAAAGIN